MCVIFSIYNNTSSNHLFIDLTARSHFFYVRIMVSYLFCSYAKVHRNYMIYNKLIGSCFITHHEHCAFHVHSDTARYNYTVYVRALYEHRAISSVSRHIGHDDIVVRLTFPLCSSTIKTVQKQAFRIHQNPWAQCSLDPVKPFRQR